MERDIQHYLNVCRRPKMHGIPLRFEAIFAYIEGYGAASGHDLLRVFRDWLQAEESELIPVGWASLILKKSGADMDSAVMLTEEQSNVAIEVLRDCLTRFLEDFHSGGLSLVYQKYNSWLASRRSDETKTKRSKLRRKK